MLAERVRRRDVGRTALTQSDQAGNPVEARPILGVPWIEMIRSQRSLPMTALRSILAFACIALISMALVAHAETVRVYVTNSAGDNIHVVDPATNKVVQVFKAPEAAH